MAKVVVGMSGGVDSSVVAAILHEQGHEVIGVFMKNWEPLDEQALGDCPWEQDQADAQAVCDKLGIQFRSVNFEKEYHSHVVEYFLREYAAGRTPNPDVLCNRDIKFDAFLKFAQQELGAEKIATGHYAQLVVDDNGEVCIGKGVDPAKDQSYFLYAVPKGVLQHVWLPLGGMHKSEVRAEAERFGLPTAGKKDSQGICFIGHLDVKQFLRDSLKTNPGHTYLLPVFSEGESFEQRLARSYVVGEHQGVAFSTIGERAGTIIDNGLYRHLRGTHVVPTYVVWKDLASNRVYVSDSATDRDLQAHTVWLEGWCGSEDISSLVGCELQVRYHDRNPGMIQAAADDSGLVKLVLDRPVHSPALGQSLVAYRGDVLLGGGVLRRYHTRI